MDHPENASRRTAKGTSPAATASKKVPWTGTLDRAIGRARGVRSKLFLFAFAYSLIVFLAMFFVLRSTFGAVYTHLPAGSGPGPLALVFVLLYATAIGALALLDFFLIRPLRALEKISPQASLGAMISGFFDRHRALESRFAQLAVEVKGLAGERQALSTEIGLLALQENTASATLRGALALTTDLLAIVETDGRVRELSPPLCELLGIVPEQAVGHFFTHVIRLFDLDEPKPLEHPLPDLVQNALAQPAGTSYLDQAILLDARGRQHKVLANVAAVAGSSGAVVSGIVRLERIVPDNPQASAPEPLHDTPEVSRDLLEDADAFTQRATVLIEQARSRNTRHMLLLLSVDGLESIDNRYGRAASESLTWEIGQVLRTQVPDGGGCFRISGMHFAVLLPNTSAEVGAAQAEKIRVAVDGREFMWEDLRYDVTVSIGAVPFGPDCEGYTALLEHADRSLVAAKTSGGNRVYVLAADEAIARQRRGDQEWVRWMSRRSQQGRIHMISQEIKPLRKGLQPMLEMLVRVEDDDGIWVTPSAFLPSLVRRSLTAKLDLQLIKRVVTAAEQGAATANDYATLCVNLSGSSITDPHFASLAVRVLSGANLPAGRICFEVDTLIAINHPAEFARFVRTVQAAGARFSLDRCKAALGLNALTTLPIDFVKIHPSLVEKATYDSLDRSYVEWINKAVQLLGRKTVATGVASEASLALVKDVGVDYVQGTHVNKLGPLML